MPDNQQANEEVCAATICAPNGGRERCWRKAGEPCPVGGVGHSACVAGTCSYVYEAVEAVSVPDAPPLKYWESTPLMDLYEDVDECSETPVLLLGVIKRLLFEVDRLNREVSRLHGEAL